MEMETEQKDGKKKKAGCVLHLSCLLLSISKPLHVLSPKKRTPHFSQENQKLLYRQAAVFS